MSSRARIAWVAFAFLWSVGFALGGSAFGQHPAPQIQKDTAAPAAKPDEAKKPDAPKPGEDKPFDEVVKDMEVKKGLFTFYYKADENKLLMEILPGQLDKVFLFAGTTERAAGERGLYYAYPARLGGQAFENGGSFPFVFHKVGKTIYWVEKNTKFTAAPGTPEARYTERSFTDAIHGTAKIASKPHPDRKSILIDAADLFLSDLPGFASGLNQAYQPTSYHFDKASSALGAVQTYPQNVLLDVWLHYVTDNPRTPSIALADSRSIPMLVKYDLSAVRETGYKPRLGDDRIGHFITVQQDFTDPTSSPYIRYVRRWQLGKADPSAQLSPPKQPIVFWLENTVPVKFRPWITEGILLWNKAFERIGFKDAIVVKQQPDHPDWEAADTRYSTIRWFAGVGASNASGYSLANPFTGQIYNARIGMSDGYIRNFRGQAEEFVTPVVPTGLEETSPPMLWGRRAQELCTYAEGLAQQASFSMSVLDARGALTPEVSEKVMHESIVRGAGHEVGHTLGLRHNFHASTMLKLDELNDVKKTDEIGQMGSVMDYSPVVIAAKGQKQGHFRTTTLGPYDYWAIEYAYKPIDGDEKAELAKIASRAADPALAYGTDDDALGTFSPLAIDPLVNGGDQSSDPLAYFKQRIEIIHELWGSMEKKLVKPGEGYQVLRRSLERSMRAYNGGLLTSSKFIGGIYHVRDHVGDPNGRPPYTPVPPAKQREALDFLRAYAFSEKAFELPPGLMNKMALERQRGLDFWASLTLQRLDFPWHDPVLTLQRNVLNRLFHPVLLARVQDNELRFAPGEKPFVMADLFKALDVAIWSELDSGATRISSLRRNLQREHMNQLIRLLLRPAPPQAPLFPFPPGYGVPTPPTPRPPEDATTLARASLVGIQAQIRRVLAGGKVTDVTTKAHLEETQARIAAALQAQLQKPLE